MRRPTTIIKASEIKENYTMKMAIDAMEGAFSSLSSGSCYVPQRSVTTLPTNEMLMLFKPAFVQKDERVTIKFLTQRDGVAMPGVPTIQGVVMVIDSVSGEILSIMDGEYLTALRTGASSGLATRYFAREDSKTVALFGCGTQGRTQLEAVLCERNIEKIYLFNRSPENANLLMKDIQNRYNIDISYTDDLTKLKDVDIICTATSSSEPLFKLDQLKAGVHINAIGSFQPHMQELDPELIERSKLYVDHIESCIKESGDLIRPIDQGYIKEDHIVGEIGDYPLGNIEGRRDGSEITIFKSVGVAIQDYAVANDIYKNSILHSFGQKIELFN